MANCGLSGPSSGCSYWYGYFSCQAFRVASHSDRSGGPPSSSWRRRSSAAGLANTEFHEADVESEPYEPWKPDLVTAHLCASDAIIEGAARALRPGSCLAMVSFHVDQWKETGKVSRFAYDEARARRVLGAAGFAIEHVEIEQEVQKFASVEQALAAAIGLAEQIGRAHV